MSTENTLSFVTLVVTLVAFVGFIFWYIFDTYKLTRLDGKISRGFCIWKRALSEDERKFLQQSKNDIITYRKFLFQECPSAFIISRAGEVLIHSENWHYSTSWPYIGYVNLSEPEPVLEYRASIPAHLFLLLLIFAAGIGIVIFAINFAVETKTIDTFLQNQIQRTTFSSLPS